MFLVVCVKKFSDIQKVHVICLMPIDVIGLFYSNLLDVRFGEIYFWHAVFVYLENCRIAYSN